MRKKIVAGNWKMNLNLTEGLKLASEVANMANDEIRDVELVLCTPFIHLKSINDLIKSSAKVRLGAQNCHEKVSGAYTGEVSVDMLESTGVQYVIIGHSERREYFKEDDQLLARKVDAVLAAQLTPLFCCGESIDIRQEGDPFSVVRKQLTSSLFHLSAESIQKIVIAYEPIWAIGTGLTATAEQAQEMHASLRAHISDKYGREVADEISILYGGSAKPGNARELFSGDDVDGGLIGGASLNSRDFIDIAKSF